MGPNSAAPDGARDSAVTNQRRPATGTNVHYPKSDRTVSFPYELDLDDWAFPEDCPTTNSAEISYSRPCGPGELQSACKASVAICPSKWRLTSTVVIEGMLYSASRVLSKPVTETSCGMRKPAEVSPFITPTAVKSFTAITALGNGDIFAMANPAARPPSNRRSPGRTGPGLRPRSTMDFS